MNKLINAIKQGAVNFARDEEGAQVVEYALIIAVVSIALIVLLRALTLTPGGFSAFIGRITLCLAGVACV